MANRCGRFWAKGKLLIDGIRAMQQRGVFVLLRGYVIPVGVIGLMLCSIVFGFVQKNPAWVVVPLIIGLVSLFLWQYLQRLAAASLEGKDHIDLEFKAWQTALQFAGGAALLVGLYFTNQTLLTSQETLRTTQEGQITERFTKAIEQLGRDNLSLRLGGIYALERIARDSAKDYGPVMQVLAAYVRERRALVQDGKEQDAPRWVSCGGKGIRTFEDVSWAGGLQAKLPPDIQAILTVFKRRARSYGTGEIDWLDLRYTQLATARLDNAHLEFAVFIGTHLQGAYLLGAHLTGAFLMGAHLEGAELGLADLYSTHLEGAYLQDACLLKAKLRFTSLQDTHLERAELQLADFQGADLRGAKNLTQQQLQMACVDEHTLLPPHLTPPDPCPILPQH
jgi:hypothetical protein